MRKLESYLANRFYPVKPARFVDRIAAACNDLATAPMRGTGHDQILPGLRSISFEGRSEIFYRVSPDEVLILGVYHRGKRPEPSDLV